MTITRNSAQFVDSTSNNSSTSVTVPSGVKGVLVFWCGIINDGTPRGMATITLGGQPVTLIVDTSDSGSPNFFRALGVGFLANPPAGSQTFAWDWDGTSAIGEGGVFGLIFYDATNNLSVRDFDSTQLTGSANTPTLTVDSSAADYVAGMAFGADPTLLTNQTGQTTDDDDHTFNGELMDLAHVNTPGASTTNFSSEFGYGGAIAVSLMESAGSSGAINLKPSKYNSLRPRAFAPGIAR